MLFGADSLRLGYGEELPPLVAVDEFIPAFPRGSTAAAFVEQPNGLSRHKRSPGQGGSTGASQPKGVIAGNDHSQECSSTTKVFAACDMAVRPKLGI